MNSHNNNNGSVFGIGGFLVGLIALLVILISIEVGRVYATRAWGKDTTTACVLWIALAIFTMIVGVAWQYVSYPATQAGAIYFLSWSFFAYVILVEACDWYERRFDPPELAFQMASPTYAGGSVRPSSAASGLPEATLDDVIGPWHAEGYAAARASGTNGAL